MFSTKHCFEKHKKMIGHYAHLRDVTGQSDPIYACTCANHAHYSSFQVTFCGSSKHAVGMRNSILRNHLSIVMQNQRVQITFNIQNHCHVNFFYSVKKKYFWFKNRNSITWHLVLLNSTDEQARQFLVCSLCEMLSNVKSETFTLVFLRDHLVFTSCMRAERTDAENTEENTSSNSPGWACFHWTLLEYQSACSTNLNLLCSRIVFY